MKANSPGRYRNLTIYRASPLLRIRMRSNIITYYRDHIMLQGLEVYWLKVNI